MLQMGKAFVASCIIGGDFLLPLADVGDEPQSDLSDGIVGHLQLEKVVGRGRGNGGLSSGLAIDCDNRRRGDLKDELRGVDTGGSRHGFVRHLVVEWASVSIWAEAGVLRDVSLGEIATEEEQEVVWGLLGYEHEAGLCFESFGKGVSLPKGEVWARGRGFEREDWAGCVGDELLGSERSDGDWEDGHCSESYVARPFILLAGR